jgi:hypothetical protein
VAAPWASPLITALLWWVVGWAPLLTFGWAFAFVLLKCTFLIVHFDMFSHAVLQNIYTPKLVENVSCKALF